GRRYPPMGKAGLCCHRRNQHCRHSQTAVSLMTTKIFTIAHVLPGLEHEWLQHLRDFDTAHPGCHFEVATDVPDVPLKQAIEMLQLTPGLTFGAIFERKPK